MAHVTLTHPDAGKPIQVPESQRAYFESIGWKEAVPEQDKTQKPETATVKRK